MHIRCPGVVFPWNRWRILNGSFGPVPRRRGERKVPPSFTPTGLHILAQGCDAPPFCVAFRGGGFAQRLTQESDAKRPFRAITGQLPALTIPPVLNKPP